MIYLCCYNRFQFGVNVYFSVIFSSAIIILYCRPVFHRYILSVSICDTIRVIK
jgi:hypothetical protein